MNHAFKSLLTITLGAIVLASTIGCSKDKTEAPPSTNATATASATSTNPVAPQTQYEENYAVGIDVTYPPFTSRNENGKPTGFEVEILEAIAADQKFGLELIHATRSSLYPDLEAGKYQILAASLKQNPERLTKSDFTDSFAKSHYTILSRKDKTVKSGKELAGAGSVAVQEATNSQKKLEEVGAKIDAYPSQFEAFKAFLSGTADYTIGDSIVLKYYLEQHAKDKMADYAFTPFDNEGDTTISFAIAKGNTKLLEKMNAGMASIKSNGKYDEIYNKYFSDKDASTNQ